MIFVVPWVLQKKIGGSYVICHMYKFPCALGRTYWPDRMKRTRNLALKAAVSRRIFWGGMDEQGWCFYHLRQLAVDMISCQIHTNTSLLRVTFHLTMVHFFGISQFIHPCNPKWSVSLIPPSPCAHLIHDTNTQERHNFWYWRLKLVNVYISTYLYIHFNNVQSIDTYSHFSLPNTLRVNQDQ